MVLAVTVVLVAAAPVSGAPPAPKEDQLTADLDGRPIKLSEVGHWYCHDFDYPVIHCFSEPARASAGLAGTATALASGVTYVTVYEYTSWQGAFMHMSENYSILALIGWSDRISSFEVHNSMSGAFWTDWLYGGTRYNFCCNQEVNSLGGYNDTFSSVFHN
jgi:hypothetical protein